MSSLWKTKHQLRQPSNQERKTGLNKINKNLNFFKNLEIAKIKQENKKIAQKPEDKNQTNKNQTRIDKFLVTVKDEKSELAVLFIAYSIRAVV